MQTLVFSQFHQLIQTICTPAVTVVNTFIKIFRKIIYSLMFMYRRGYVFSSLISIKPNAFKMRTSIYLSLSNVTLLIQQQETNSICHKFYFRPTVFLYFFCNRKILLIPIKIFCFFLFFFISNWQLLKYLRPRGRHHSKQKISSFACVALMDGEL